MKTDIQVLILGLVAFFFIVLAVYTYKQPPQRYSLEQPDEQKATTDVGEKTTIQPTLLTPTLYPELTTLEQVFVQQPTDISSPDTISLLATGDVLLARSVNYKMRQLEDFNWPFARVAPFLQSSDITYINLETPLVADCPSTVDGMIFCGDPRGVEGLRYGGVDVVNIANNHSANYGLEGVIETENILAANNFVVSGRAANNAGYLTVKDTRFAFLGYNEVNDQAGIARALDDTIVAEITVAKSQADLVIVQFHWGTEYTYKPTENQKRLARLAIDAGADLIVGNHPHWYQPITFYKGKLITYSHGNFVFDQMWSTETREGIVGQYIFQDKKLVAVEFTPIRIDNYGQPIILEGSERQKILDNLRDLSFGIRSD